MKCTLIRIIKILIGKKKCSKYFNPKDFQSEYTEHGIKYEDKARIKFVSLFNFTSY